MRTPPQVLGTALLGLVLALTATATARADSTTFPSVTQINSNQQGNCLAASTAHSELTPWPQAFLRPDLAWRVSRGAGVTVAVVDSGVADGSGFLAGRLTLGAREFGSGGAGRDCVGHGTFLAALIAAQDTGSGFAGIAPEARILAVSVTDNAGQTNAALLAAGIRAAANEGARIIDIGVALPADDPVLAAAVAYAVDKNDLVVAPWAADGQQQAAPVYPAAYPSVLSVTDLGPGGTLNSLASAAASATPAPTPSPSVSASGGGTPRVDLAAPGDAVLGIGPGSGGEYTGSGPSFATAFVAGTAALVLAHQPGLSAEQLVQRLESTAYHLGAHLPDPGAGYGTIDPVAAVTDTGGPNGSIPAARTSGPGMSLPTPPGTADIGQSLGVGAAAIAVVAAAGLGAAVLPRGRRRHWRPARYSVSGTDDPKTAPLDPS